MANQNLSQFGENTSVSDADYTFVWDSAASISKKVSRNSWLNSGTLTSDAPVTISQTWGTTGIYTAAKINVTETATANALSKLLDLQVGTVSKFAVFKDGSVQATLISTNGVGALNLQYGATGKINCFTDLDVLATNRIAFSDTFLQRDGAANTLALRNGAAAQVFNVYNTYTNASNYERAVFGYGSNQINLGSDVAGSGVHRKLNILGAGIDFYHAGIGIRWSINTSGHFLAATHNQYDIGASGANSPRDIHAGGNGIFGGLISALNGFRAPSSSQLIASANGIWRLTNSNADDFNRLQFGGTADSFPAIARDGAGIKFTGAAAGSTAWIKVPPVAVGSLPVAATAGAGARAFVNDASAPVFGTAVVGGGAVLVPVYCTGSAWNVG